MHLDQFLPFWQLRLFHSHVILKRQTLFEMQKLLLAGWSVLCLFSYSTTFSPQLPKVSLPLHLILQHVSFDLIPQYISITVLVNLVMVPYQTLHFFKLLFDVNDLTLSLGCTEAWHILVGPTSVSGWHCATNTSHLRPDSDGVMRQTPVPPMQCERHWMKSSHPSSNSSQFVVSTGRGVTR